MRRNRLYDVVVDTSVLVSALLSRQGASHRLLRLWGDPRWRAHLSAPLVAEYEAVLKRRLPALPLSPAEVDHLLEDLCALSTLWVHKHFRLRPTLPDPNDEFILELAVLSQSDFIVTHNTRDFQPASQFGIMVLRPHEFLRIVEAGQ